jgi:hypothetical protein
LTVANTFSVFVSHMDWIIICFGIVLFIEEVVLFPCDRDCSKFGFLMGKVIAESRD